MKVARLCSVLECNSKHYAKHLCKMHYERLKKCGFVGSAKRLVAKPGNARH